MVLTPVSATGVHTFKHNYTGNSSIQLTFADTKAVFFTNMQHHQNRQTVIETASDTQDTQERHVQYGAVNMQRPFADTSAVAVTFMVLSVVIVAMTVATVYYYNNRTYEMIVNARSQGGNV